MKFEVFLRKLRSVWLFLLKVTYTYDLYRKIRFEIDFLKKEGYIKKPKKTSGEKVVTTLLVVVPSQYEAGWECGQGNFFYEIYQSAKERFPNVTVSIFQATANEIDWKKRLRMFVEGEKPDCIFVYAETDPDGSGDWTWPEFFLSIADKWSGKSVFLLFDSAYPIHRWRASKLARITGNATIASIDRKPRRSLKKDIRQVGPIFLPMSMESIQLIQQQIESKVRQENLCTIDISFIGKMYPYRRKIFDVLENSGLCVELNPHRNYLEPDSYLSYLTALHLSTFTINLSLAGGVKVKQLKCRVLETAIFGNTLVTDENEFGGMFFKRDLDYVYVKRMDRLSQEILEGKERTNNKDRRESAHFFARFNFLD
jgi:hypothetical protein